MKSFSKRNDHQNQNRTCIHGKSKVALSRQRNTQKVKPNQMMEEKLNVKNECSIVQKVIEDPLKSQLKSLIALNQNYFQDKLNVPDDGRRSNLKIKIPSRTGGTAYKRDYQNTMASSLTMKSAKKGFVPVKSQQSNNFFDETTYKAEFLPRKGEVRNSQKKEPTKLDQNAPAFHETQYKNTFLNWGGMNNIMSMKPCNRPAVTNLPLQTHSAYSLDYTHKKQIPVKSFKPIYPVPNFKDKQNKASSASTALTYLTTSKLFYDPKHHSKEQSLKPKNQTVNVNGNFKGKTQYQSKYLSIESDLGCKNAELSLEELQNLMVGA